MKSVQRPPLQRAPSDSGLVLFDEYLNDEDFLEFLIEWSDSIVHKDTVNASPGANINNIANIAMNISNTRGSNRGDSVKRKIDQASLSPQGEKTGKKTGKFDEKTGIAENNEKTGNTDGIAVDNIDAALVKLPIGIFDSFNTGDLQHLRDLVKEGMTPDCLFKTMMIDQPLVGRHVYSEFWTKLSVSHPDMVFILKKVRVTDKVGEPRCIKFNYFFTGTNTFPGATETYYYNNDDYLTKNLDSSKYSEKEKNAVNLLVAQHRAHGTPYVAFGRGSGCYKLNEENKVNSISFEWKLTSICPPVCESSY